MSATDPTAAEVFAAARRFARTTVALTTDAAGNATAYTTGSVNGLLIAAYIDKGTLAATVDITITEEDTAAAILTLTNVSASARYMPRVPSHDAVGVATGALDAAPVTGRVKVVVAQGGNVATGTLYLYIDGVAA